MEKRTKPSILQNFDCEVTALIAQNRGISQTEALRRFLNSKTHEMLEDDDMKLWYFSPLAVYDIWEAEEATGDPGNSLYLRGDEILVRNLDFSHICWKVMHSIKEQLRLKYCGYWMRRSLRILCIICMKYIIQKQLKMHIWTSIA